MKTSEFDYHLPPELIAQTPVEPRDSSRLLVLHRSSGRVEHTSFDGLGQYLRAGDLLTLNDTKVIRGRLRARRKKSGARVEFLLLRRIDQCLWQAVGRPGRRLKAGERYVVESGEVEIEVRGRGDEGTLTLHLSTEEGMDRWGETPLPPYVSRPLEDPERYQTIYAQEPGSAAVPTAGLHFTRELMEGLASQGVNRVYLTLHVGLDTFRPVESEDPRMHRIHKEYCRVDPIAAAVINSTRRQGGKVVAVGTTSVRTLEQAALWSARQGVGELAPASDWAQLLILPGHSFQMVDAFITNFHLPRSTTLMMASAFAGRDLLMEAYREAIKERYRFYSFGDAMLII